MVLRSPTASELNEQKKRLHFTFKHKNISVSVVGVRAGFVDIVTRLLQSFKTVSLFLCVRCIVSVCLYLFLDVKRTEACENSAIQELFSSSSSSSSSS